MTRQLRTLLVQICGALLLGATLAMVMPHAAHGAVIATDDALATQQASADRERVRALVLRPELAQSLEKMGIAPQDAAARVDAMSDAEVRSLAGRLDALPAGGALGNTDFLLIIIIVILVVVLI